MGGCGQSIGSTVSDAIVRSWLWSIATRSSPLCYFSNITASSLQLPDSILLWGLLVSKTLLYLLYAWPSEQGTNCTCMQDTRDLTPGPPVQVSEAPTAHACRTHEPNSRSACPGERGTNCTCMQDTRDFIYALCLYLISINCTVLLVHYFVLADPTDITASGNHSRKLKRQWQFAWYPLSPLLLATNFLGLSSADASERYVVVRVLFRP